MGEDPIGFGSSDFNFYRYSWNSPTNFIDPYGYNAGTYAGGEIGFALGGPVGALAGAAIGTAVIWWGVPAIWDWWNSPDDNVCYAKGKKSKSGTPDGVKQDKEHTSNPSKSKKKKHQKGRGRKDRDGKGGEKGDARRPYQR